MTVTVEVGLYRDNERLPLQTAGAADREITARTYKVATLQLAPQADNIFLIYKSGWYPQEFSSTDPAVSGGRGRGKSAVIDFKNPHTDTTLYIEFGWPAGRVQGHPQTVTVVANGQPVGRSRPIRRDAVLHRLPIPAASLGLPRWPKSG